MSTNCKSPLYSAEECFFDQADRLCESTYSKVQNTLRKVGYFHLFSLCLLTIIGCSFINAYITHSHPVILSALLASLFFVAFSYLLGSYLIKIKKWGQLDDLAHQFVTKLQHIHLQHSKDAQPILTMTKALTFFSAYAEKKRDWKSQKYTFSPSDLCKADYIHFQENTFSLLIEQMEKNSTEMLFDPLFHHHLAMSYFSFASQYASLSVWKSAPWYSHLFSNDQSKKNTYFKKALTEWQLAYHLNQENYAPLFHCYECYLQLNDEKKQCEVLETLYQQNQLDDEMISSLAVLYFKNNCIEKGFHLVLSLKEKNRFAAEKALNHYKQSIC